MEKIKQSKAYSLTSPNSITLVCTTKPDGKTNLAAVSWWMYSSSNPPFLCFAMSKKSYSGELVRQTKKVALAMPGSAIADAAFNCGTVSGRNADKAKEFGIELKELPGVSIQVPAESRLVFDCALDNVLETGDHYVFACAVNNVFADESKTQIFAWDGYSKLAPLSK